MSASSATSEVDTFVITTFTEDEEIFLNEYIPSWRAKFYGPQVKSRKGQKKTWIIDKPYPQFISKFYPGDTLKPHNRRLQEKMYRWFLNRASENIKTASKHRPKPSSGLKIPRATNAFEIFSEERKADILELGREKAGLSTSSDNLTIYKESSKELWDSLTDEAKEEYAKKASEKNELVKSGPTEKDIERNQSRIIENTMAALNKLIGNNWTGHGNAAFFVLGAYRKADGKVNTFHGSVSEDNDAATAGFHRVLPDFKENVKERFHAWAEKVIPGGRADIPEAASPAAEIPDIPGLELLDDGYPVLPRLDVDEIAPRTASLLLRQFFTAAWCHAVGSSSPDCPIPWTVIGSPDWHCILEDPLVFRQFSCLDPAFMSTGDTYSVLRIIIAEQKKGLRPLRFLHENYATTANQVASPKPSNPVLLHSPDAENRSRSAARRAEKIDFSPPRPKGQAAFFAEPCQPEEQHKDRVRERSRPPSSKAASRKRKRLTEMDEETEGEEMDEEAADEEMDEEATDEEMRRSPGKPSCQKRRKLGPVKASQPSRPKKIRKSGGQKVASTRRKTAKSGQTQAHASKVTNKRETTQTAPLRVQSARIRDKNYKNTNVTVRIRDP